MIRPQPSTPLDPPLQVAGEPPPRQSLALALDTSGQAITGRAPAGVLIEAINLSVAPKLRVFANDTFALANADPEGRFQGIVPGAAQGDVIRLRARAGDSFGPWVTTRADGLASEDARPPELELQRVQVTKRAEGEYSLTFGLFGPLCERCWKVVPSSVPRNAVTPSSRLRKPPPAIG